MVRGRLFAMDLGLSSAGAEALQEARTYLREGSNTKSRRALDPLSDQSKHCLSGKEVVVGRSKERSVVAPIKER